MNTGEGCRASAPARSPFGPLAEDRRQSSGVAVLKTGRKIYDGDPAPLRDHVRLMELF